MTSLAGRADSGLLTEQQANARIFSAMAGLPETPRHGVHSTSRMQWTRLRGWQDSTATA